MTLTYIDSGVLIAAETAGADELITAERPSSPLSRVIVPRIISIHP